MSLNLKNLVDFKRICFVELKVELTPSKRFDSNNFPKKLKPLKAINAIKESCKLYQKNITY